MTELPTHLHLFPRSSVTLNAMHFKYIYESESLKILDFPTHCLEAAQASCPMVAGEPRVTAGLAGQWPPWQGHNATVPEWGEQGRLRDRNQGEPQRVSADRQLGWGRVGVKPASQVRVRNSKAGVGHICSVAQERPKTEGLSLNATPE